LRGECGGLNKKFEYSADEVLELFEGYLEDCRNGGRRATWEGFAGELELPSEVLTEKLGSGGKMGKALSMVRDALTDELLQRSDSMAIFTLKQAKYGGYNDKQSGDGAGGIKVEVSLKGVRGAFD